MESQLRLDDPAFVERFMDESKRRADGGWRGAAAVVALIVALAAVAVGLVLASVVTVVIALTAIGAITGQWITAACRPQG